MRQNYYSVVADLFWRAYDLAAGAYQVLAVPLRTPLLAIQRALFECTTTVMYLTQQPDPEGEAVIYRACAILRELDLVPMGEDEIADRQRILSAMPQVLVAEAQRRKPGRGWSGKSWKKMTAEIGFSDYSIYEYLSEYAHAKLGGTHVRVAVHGSGNGQVSFREQFQPFELVYAANFARRMLFHAFDALRVVYQWESVDLVTTDPYEWFHRMESEQPSEG